MNSYCNTKKRGLQIHDTVSHLAHKIYQEGIMWILVVDDDGEIRDVMNTFLSRIFLGAQICLAADVPEALELMAKYKFDIISTDFEMPSGSGAEIVREAQKNPPRVLMILSGTDPKKIRAQLVDCPVQIWQKSTDWVAIIEWLKKQWGAAA